LFIEIVFIINVYYVLAFFPLKYSSLIKI